MAATRTKKSAAYEAGLREGRADKSKKPKIEIEISPEGEEEEVPEGEEEMDAAKPTNRKRSAKNSHRTTAPMDGGMYGKKPMDGECGCGGKGRKGKAACDGSCGGMKKDRADAALTPHEYLAACELGIQDRSRPYIRARLDAAERLDLKCGRGSISPGEKCTKGAATKAQALRTAAKVAGAVALVSAGALAGRALANKATSISNNVAARNKARMREMGATRQRKWAAVWGTNKLANEAGPFQRGRAQENYQTARDRLYGAMSAQRRELNRMKRFAPKSAARKRAARRGRRDSVYAPGFSPDLAQLAI